MIKSTESIVSYSITFSACIFVPQAWFLEPIDDLDFSKIYFQSQSLSYIMWAAKLDVFLPCSMQAKIPMRILDS